MYTETQAYLYVKLPSPGRINCHLMVRVLYCRNIKDHIKKICISRVYTLYIHYSATDLISLDMYTWLDLLRLANTIQIISLTYLWQ